MKNTIYETLNQIIRETLDHYYQHQDAESFFKLVNYLNTCNEYNLTNKEIPTFIEMKNVIVMG